MPQIKHIIVPQAAGNSDAKNQNFKIQAELSKNFYENISMLNILFSQVIHAAMQ